MEKATNLENVSNHQDTPFGVSGHDSVRFTPKIKYNNNL